MRGVPVMEKGLKKDGSEPMGKKKD